MPELDFDDFMAAATLSDLAVSLSEWATEGLADLRPVGMTLFGDIFLIDKDNAVTGQAAG